MKSKMETIELENFALREPMLRWDSFTDRIIGGRSDMEPVALVQEEPDTFLRVKGHVSLRDGGGFLQSRLVLGSIVRAYDASSWLGFRVRMRGSSGHWEAHLRTFDCRVPWAYYATGFEPDDTWQDFYFPFSGFTAVNVNEPLVDAKRIMSFAFVAAWHEFDALLDVERVGLFRH